jgi:hypothetical protein
MPLDHLIEFGKIDGVMHMDLQQQTCSLRKQERR